MRQRRNGGTSQRRRKSRAGNRNGRDSLARLAGEKISGNERREAGHIFAQFSAITNCIMKNIAEVIFNRLSRIIWEISYEEAGKLRTRRNLPDWRKDYLRTANNWATATGSLSSYRGTMNKNLKARMGLCLWMRNSSLNACFQQGQMGLAFLH